MPRNIFASPQDNPAEPAKVALLALLCLAWVLPGLVGHDPWKPDEAYSFGLVYHILQSNDWVVPTLAGEPFMEKPPLYYIVAAFFARMFSSWLPLHDGARLATGAFMGLTLLFTGLAGRELLGRGNGRIAVMILMGSLGLLLRAHELITDMALLTGFALAFYGLALALRLGWQAGLALGTGAGIAFMAKGLIGPGLIGLTALSLFFFEGWRSRRYLGCLAVAALAMLPWLTLWPWLLYQRSPQLFMDWFWTNNFGRFFGFSKLGPGSSGRWTYVAMLPWFAWPSLPLALWALWNGGVRGIAQPRIQYPLAAFLIMLAVLSAASDAREVYALPLLLPLALLGAESVRSLRRGAASALDWFGVTTFTLFTGLLWLGWSAMIFGEPAKLARYLLEIQPGYQPRFVWLHFLVALGFTLLWLAVITRVQRSNRRAILNWAAGITLFWGVFMTLWLPWLDAGKSYRSMIAELARHLPGQSDCVASHGLGEPQRAMLHYHANLLTERAPPGAPIKCGHLLTQGSAGDSADMGSGWKPVWDGARPGDTSERYRLYRRIP
jgi:4-amino-4-deoxy-L-arabinose transferase-like glycosyltransferase